MTETLPASTAADPNWAVPPATNGASIAVRPVEPEIVVPDAPAAAAAPSGGSEQMARIEDKTSRIEEKFARSEAAMQRVVDRFDQASSRMGEVALQSELAAVRGEVSYIARRIRNVPGLTALALTAIVTSLLTAIVFIAILRFMPGLLAR